MRNKIILIIILLIGLVWISWPAHGMMLVGGKPAAAAGGTACVGYLDDQTDCDYSTAANPGGMMGADITRLRNWTASVNGTVSRVKVFCADSACPTDGTITVVYYNGNELRGTATFTCSRNSWVWSGDFAAYSGRSLTFSSSDTVRFGVSFDYASSSFTVGRTSDAVTPNQHSQSAYLPDPVSTASANYDVSFILEYDY